MNIIISDVDFWDNFEAMKYWSHPKSYDIKKKKEEARHMIFSGEYIGARKVDGIWSMIIKDSSGNFHLRSRTKNVDGTYADKGEWIPTITDELKTIPNGSVIVGEIYKYKDEGSRKATSILNCLKEKSLQRQRQSPLHFYAFDVLAWDNKILIETSISKRIEYLSYIKPIKSIEIAHYYCGKDLWELYLDTIANGQEGIVIQRKDIPYTCGKRTARLTLKMKKELNDTIDAFIDGAYVAATRDYTGSQIDTWQYWYDLKNHKKLCGNYFKNYLSGDTIIPITKSYYLNYAGSLSFSVMKDGNPVRICWISGIPDEMKKGIVQNPDEWINKVFSISAMEIEHINDNYSLRHAKIIEERPDKTPNDCDWSQIVNN